MKDRPVNPAFHRLGLLVGGEALAVLAQTRVIVFGLGGVGGWAAEALVRSGAGHITIVDNDTVCVTNINRQIQALQANLGLPKSALLLKRLLEINGQCEVRAFNNVFSRETADLFEIERADYVIDAIDSLSCKLDLIETTLNASKRGPPSGAGPGSSGAGPRLFSSMGMACKLDPTRLRTADIWETEGCPLARLVRRGLRKRGFAGHFTVVYSDEVLPPAEGEETVCGGGGCFCTDTDNEWCSSKKTINGSAVTVTAAAGMVLAGLVIRDVYDRTAAARSVRG